MHVNEHRELHEPTLSARRILAATHQPATAHQQQPVASVLGVFADVIGTAARSGSEPPSRLLHRRQRPLRPRQRPGAQSTLAGLAAIVICSPVPGLRPSRAFRAGLSRTVSCTRPPIRTFERFRARRARSHQLGRQRAGADGGARDAWRGRPGQRRLHSHLCAEGERRHGRLLGRQQIRADMSITSGASTTVGMRSPFDFTVTTAGYPTTAIVESGSLPTGVTFTDNGDGTADLAGTARLGPRGLPITITASDEPGSPAVQSFTLRGRHTFCVSAVVTVTVTPWCVN